MKKILELFFFLTALLILSILALKLAYRAYELDLVRTQECSGLIGYERCKCEERGGE